MRRRGAMGNRGRWAPVLRALYCKAAHPDALPYPQGPRTACRVVSTSCLPRRLTCTGRLFPPLSRSCQPGPCEVASVSANDHPTWRADPGLTTPGSEEGNTKSLPKEASFVIPKDGDSDMILPDSPLLLNPLFLFPSQGSMEVMNG